MQSLTIQSISSAAMEAAAMINRISSRNGAAYDAALDLALTLNRAEALLDSPDLAPYLAAGPHSTRLRGAPAPAGDLDWEEEAEDEEGQGVAAAAD